MRLFLGFGVVLALSACGLMPKSQSATPGEDPFGKVKGPEVSGVQDTLVASAKEAENVGNFKRAAQVYKQALDQSPEDGDLQFAYATALRRGGQCGDARPIFDAMVAKDPKSVDALEGKALCAMAQDDSKEATELFQQVLTLDPKRWRALNAVGILFAGKGKVSEAIAYFEKAEEVSSGHVAVMNNLGLTYLLDKRYEEAIATFQRAQKHLPSKSPDESRIAQNLSMAYALAGDMDSAQKAAAPYLSEAALYNNLGFYAKLAKDDQLARDYLNMSLAKSPIFYKRAWENLSDVQSGARNKNSSDGAVKVGVLRTTPRKTQPLTMAKEPEKKAETPKKKAEPAKDESADAAKDKAKEEPKAAAAVDDMPRLKPEKPALSDENRANAKNDPLDKPVILPADSVTDVEESVTKP